MVLAVTMDDRYKNLPSPYVLNGGATDVGPDASGIAAYTESDEDIARRIAMSARQPVDLRDLRGRIPSVNEYFQSRQVIPIRHGYDTDRQELGFAARCIVVQNLQATGYLYIPEIQMFVPPLTALAHFNIPERTERVSFLWYTSPTTPGGVTPVAGAYAIAWLYDEWTLPSALFSISDETVTAVISGTVTVAGTVAVSEIATPVSVVVTAADQITPVPLAVSSAITSVNDTASSTTLLAANSSRRSVTIFNDSDQILYVKEGATASATSFTYRLLPGDTLEMGSNGTIYQGVVDGIWAADSTGAARITERTS